MTQPQNLVIPRPTLEQSRDAVFGIREEWSLGERVSAVLHCAEINIRDCVFAWPDPAWKAGNFVVENVIPRHRDGLQTVLESRALEPFLGQMDSKYMEEILLRSGLEPGSDVSFLREKPTLAELYGIAFAALRHLIIETMSEFASKTTNPVSPVIVQLIERNRAADKFEEEVRSRLRDT